MKALSTREWDGDRGAITVFYCVRQRKFKTSDTGMQLPAPVHRYSHKTLLNSHCSLLAAFTFTNSAKYQKNSKGFFFFWKVCSGKHIASGSAYVSLFCSWLLLLLLLVNNLHHHVKSPQDPYVVVALCSLCLSSVYCMPFHLAACCSKTVNSLITGWKLWKRATQSLPPSKLAIYTQFTQKKNAKKV